MKAPIAILRSFDEVGNVHEYAATLNAKKYRYACPGVQCRSWGWDDMSISDPNGNKLIFCTRNDR